MVTLAEYLALNKNVYQSDANNPATMPNGWSVSTSVPDLNNPDDGFFGRVYVKGDAVVVVFRGTDTQTDWRESNFQLATGRVPQQYTSAKAFYEQVESDLLGNVLDHLGNKTYINPLFTFSLA